MLWKQDRTEEPLPGMLDSILAAVRILEDNILSAWKKSKFEVWANQTGTELGQWTGD